MKLTRRQLAAALAAPAAAAQTAAPAPGQELDAARKRAQQHAEAMDKVRLPRETEPAFQFKA